MFKKLKYIDISYSNKEFRIYGDNKFVRGKIFITSKAYLYSILVFILRVFRKHGK